MSSCFYSKALLLKEQRNVLLLGGFHRYFITKYSPTHINHIWYISVEKGWGLKIWHCDGYQWNQSNKNPLNQLYTELNEAFCVHNGILDSVCRERSLYCTGLEGACNSHVPASLFTKRKYSNQWEKDLDVCWLWQQHCQAGGISCVFLVYACSGGMCGPCLGCYFLKPPVEATFQSDHTTKMLRLAWGNHTGAWGAFMITGLSMNSFPPMIGHYWEMCWAVSAFGVWLCEKDVTT